MKVVVTGGAGFIGANLCRRLASHPDIDEVVILDDLSTGSLANLDGLAVTFVAGSILDRDLLRTVVAPADAVVHLAARPSVPRSVADPVASHQANATGTVYVLEACRDSGARVVVASSSSVYGNVAALPKHEGLPTRPQSPYAASKLATEAYALAYAATFGLGSLVFRFFNVYGPLQAAGHAYAAVVPTFVDAALRGQPLPIHGDGRQTRDFTFVGSVVEVLTQAVLTGVRCAEPVNLAFGSRTSLLELVAQLARLLDAPVRTAMRPARVGDVRDSQACDAGLRALFPDLTPVPLQTGLASTVAWFRTLPQYAAPSPSPTIHAALPDLLLARPAETARVEDLR